MSHREGDRGLAGLGEHVVAHAEPLIQLGTAHGVPRSIDAVLYRREVMLKPMTALITSGALALGSATRLRFPPMRSSARRTRFTPRHAAVRRDSLDKIKDGALTGNRSGHRPGLSEIQAIADNTGAPTFENTLVAIDRPDAYCNEQGRIRRRHWREYQSLAAGSADRRGARNKRRTTMLFT